MLIGEAVTENSGEVGVEVVHPKGVDFVFTVIVKSIIPHNAKVFAASHDAGIAHGVVAQKHAVDHADGVIDKLGIDGGFVVGITRFFVGYDARHAGIHVVEEVAVEEPVVVFIGEEFDGATTHGRNVDGVFERRARALTIEEAEEVPMEMQG